MEEQEAHKKMGGGTVRESYGVATYLLNHAQGSVSSPIIQYQAIKTLVQYWPILVLYQGSGGYHHKKVLYVEILLVCT